MTRTASQRREENEIAQLIEDFLFELEGRLSRRERHEYSVDEMERQMEGVGAMLSVLSQRWSLVIIFLLGMKSLSFNELRELLAGISSRSLTDKLRLLELNGILTRNVASSGPVRVSYRLTKRGREVALSSLPLLYRLRKLR